MNHRSHRRLVPGMSQLSIGSRLSLPFDKTIWAKHEKNLYSKYRIASENG